MQDNMTTYASRQFKAQRRNYPTNKVLTDYSILMYVFTQIELILRQLRWMKPLKDYDITIQYHQGRAGVVEDALRRKSIIMGRSSCLKSTKFPLAKE